jgi:hypothetical protein
MNFATAKLIGMGLGALALIALVVMVLGWRTERNHLRDWQAQTLAATRDASGSPKLAAKDVPQQIRFLGEAIAALHTSLERQNAAVDALGRESEQQKAEAAKASEKAAERSRGAEATADRLTASSRSGESLRGSQQPCKASKAVEEVWR